MSKDYQILRQLAGQYAAIALSQENLGRMDHYRKLNSLEQVAPPILIFEVPWGEFSDCDELRLQCTESAENRAMEEYLRQTIYQWKHFQGAYAVHPYFRVKIALHESDYGLSIKERTIQGDSGAYIMSHDYQDLLPDEEAVAKLRFPTIWHDTDETARRMDYASNLFDGLLPVKKAGTQFGAPSWDDISMLHGVDECMIDLIDRPEFSHLIIDTFTKIQEYRLSRYEELNVLDTDPMYLHCTPACTYDLPVKDMDTEKITAKDVWCRAMAQIFSMVSPQMHDEFDLQYTQRLFDRCGLSYYGCCEPLHDKVPQLRRFKNLRRISISPWADPDIAADNIGRDYVLSCKPNPAHVASPVFDPAPVREEIARVTKACRRNGCAFELVLKDISTVANNPENLTQWMETATQAVADNW